MPILLECALRVLPKFAHYGRIARVGEGLHEVRILRHFRKEILIEPFVLVFKKGAAHGFLDLRKLQLVVLVLSLDVSEVFSGLGLSC